MPQLLCPTLIGRDDEMSTIADALDRAIAGAGGVVVVIGEAGLGKSRIAREASALARQHAMPVLLGREVQEHRASSFRALSEALLAAFRTDAPPDDSDLAPFRRHLSRLVPQWRSDGDEHAGPATELDGANDLVLAEGVLRLLRTLAGRTGCLLVLEDLHWADEETLAVLEYLADNLHTEHALCLATVRRGEHNPAERRVHMLAARRAATVLDLAPLTADQVEQMSAACLRLPRLPARFGRSVVDRAEGVPFLVEELLAGLAARGFVRRQLDRWEVPDEPAATAIVPVSFAETVLSRLEALGPPARQVLNAAAVLGRRFDWSLLPSVTGMDQEGVTRALSGAVDAQLLTADEGFRFRHALTRDAVLAHLLPPDRVDLSRRALDALVAAHPDLPGRWCDLAPELAEQAGDRHRAASSLLEAGRRAFNDGGLTVAQTVLERARGQAQDDPLLLGRHRRLTDRGVGARGTGGAGHRGRRTAGRQAGWPTGCRPHAGGRPPAPGPRRGCIRRLADGDRACRAGTGPGGRGHRRRPGCPGRGAGGAGGDGHPSAGPGGRARPPCTRDGAGERASRGGL
ncbi:MAG TPA: AAA family ATPase [Nakamurella sp.]